MLELQKSQRQNGEAETKTVNDKTSVFPSIKAPVPRYFSVKKQNSNFFNINNFRTIKQKP